MTVTKTVFIGAVAIVATAFHGCGNKEEENQNSDETQSTETDEQEQVLKARQRDTENAVRLTLKQAEEIRDLKAKNQALKESAKACRADGNCCAGNAGCDTVADDEMREAFEKIATYFLRKHGKSSLDDLTDEQQEELTAIMEEHEHDFFKAKSIVTEKMSEATMEKLGKKVEKLRAAKGDTVAEHSLNIILGEYAQKYDLDEDNIDELQEMLTEQDALEISQRLEDHELNFKPVLEKNVHAQKVAQAQKANEKFNQMMDDRRKKDGELQDADLQELAADMYDSDADYEAVAAFNAKTETDPTKKALLEKIEGLIRTGGHTEEEIAEAEEQFMADVHEKYGKPFEQLTHAEIADLAKDLDTFGKMQELQEKYEAGDEDAEKKLDEMMRKQDVAMRNKAASDPRMRHLVDELDRRPEAAKKTAKPHTGAAVASGEPKKQVKKGGKKPRAGGSLAANNAAF